MFLRITDVEISFWTHEAEWRREKKKVKLQSGIDEQRLLRSRTQRKIVN